MNEPVIVFDFDKTLTGNDTILGFYRAASTSKFKFYMKLPFLYGLAILAKLGIISNTSLKGASVQLFLKGFDKTSLEKIGEEYASSIKLNEIYYHDFVNYSPDQVLIMSASYEEYLKPLFPDHTVIASKISYSKDDRVQGILKNIYGESKREWLLKNGIRSIDVLYTDSYSDKPLMEISRCIWLVEKNKKKLLMSNDDNQILRLNGD